MGLRLCPVGLDVWCGSGEGPFALLCAPVLSRAVTGLRTNRNSDEVLLDSLELSVYL